MKQHTALPRTQALFQLFEERLRASLPEEHEAPHVLHRAMRYAVLSGGKRLRPRLLLAVAEASSKQPPCAATQQLALTAACAVELVHCASLVHDDLPSFDNAATRRGLPTVHVAFGEPLAVLVGDALLTLAFEVLAEAPARHAARAMRMIRQLARQTGSQEGITGGQSLEGSPTDLRLLAPGSVTRYHAMKTAALFRFAAEAGATAVGVSDLRAWADFGTNLGLAYQLADDLYDASGEPSEAGAGKPVGRDAELGRPNAVRSLGLLETRASLRALLTRAHQQVQALAPRPERLTALLSDFTAMYRSAPDVTARAS